MRADSGDRREREAAEGERRRLRWLDLLRAPKGGEEPQRLRSHLAQAGKILPPKGPIHAFVAQNPLQGLEHLPFDIAVREAQRLFGAQGYPSPEAFRRIYASGRITRDDLARALEIRFPALSSRPPVEVRGRRVEARDVCLVHLLHQIDPLPHGALRWQVFRGKATRRFRQDVPPEIRRQHLDRARRGEREGEADAVSALWTAVLETLGLGDPASLEEREAQAAESLLGRIFEVARDGLNSREALADLVQGAREALQRDIGGIGSERALGDLCQRLTGARVTGTINDQMVRWCAAFLDEGLAGWPMPYRERGLYHAWRRLAERDPALLFLGVRGFTGRIRQLPLHPEEAVIGSLRLMGIPEEHWTGYLTLHLAALPGWAGVVKWREAHPDYPMQERYPIDLTQYLAVRLFYEAELVSRLCRREWGVEGTVPALRAYFQAHPGEFFARSQIAMGGLPDAMAAGIVRTGQGAIGLNWTALLHPAHGDMRQAKSLGPNEQWSRFAEMLYVCRKGADHHVEAVCHDAWRLFQLAQVLGLSAEDVGGLTLGQAKAFLGLLDDLSPAAHGPIWLEAYETHYRDQLLTRLNENRGPASRGERRPRAQLIFCLDVREEGIRRHLEAQSEEYETLGTAGFFAVPILFRPLSDGEERESCPIVIKPRHTVIEAARPDERIREHHRERRARWKEVLHALYHRLETNVATAYFLIDLLGLPFAIAGAARTLLPLRWRGLTAAVHDRFVPSVRTFLQVGRPTAAEAPELLVPQGHGHATPHRDALHTFGFSPEEQADLVEGQFRMIGLTQNFARLVLFCGHGSTTANNPYAAAYHCGACGGNRGGPNARTIAAMANAPTVRALLAARGIVIPDDTHVLGAEHDTAADRMTYFDAEDIPPTHREEFQRLAHDLHRACGRHAQERCRRLPLAPENPTPEQALRHVYARTVDWAQVYPEWGHATCAAMVIGRRALTRGVSLDRRAYLQSYDPDQDPDGAILAEIMAAFIPVVRGISLDYYFSSVDSGINGVFGAGTKALHNVVGLIGVMQGPGSDLKSGLPAQGVAPLHEPMRVHLLVEARPGKVASIIAQHKVLENIFRNQWSHLIAWDPETKQFMRYRPDGSWETLREEGRAPDAPVGRG